MIKHVSRLCALAFFASACLATERPATTEAQLRSSFEVPADVRLLYKDENGATIPFETFARSMGKGKSATLIKNLAKHEYTLTMQATAGPPPQPKLTRLPDFVLPDLAGRRISSSDLVKRPAIVSFFFDQCAPCIKEVPILNAFARKHPEYNYLAITFDSKDAAKQFVKQRHLEWPVAADAKNYLDAAGINSFPTYLLIAPGGAVLGQGSGLSMTSMKDAAAGLREFEQWVETSKQSGASHVSAGTPGVQPAGEPGWHALLDPKLSQFDVYLGYRGDQITSVLKGTASKDLRPAGLNPAGQTVFTTVEQDGRPVLRVSGEIYGCAATKQDFSNFHFRAKVKFGEKKWEPRLAENRDSGVLYFSRGEFGVDYWKAWALSQEFQVIEHGIGEYWTIADAAIDIRVGPKETSPDKSPDAPKWNPKAPWLAFVAPNNHALAGSDEFRAGEWNELDLVCFGDSCVHVVNGKVVMALTHSRHKVGDGFAPMTRGKFQIQSEAAEVFYKDIEVRSIPAMPDEYAAYFK